MSIYLDPEVEEGNIEYKRYLSDLNEQRLEEYISQMIWRVREGNGEAIYYLGVEDKGTFYNWTENEKKQTLNTLNNESTFVNKAGLFEKYCQRVEGIRVNHDDGSNRIKYCSECNIEKGKWRRCQKINFNIKRL